MTELEAFTGKRVFRGGLNLSFVLFGGEVIIGSLAGVWCLCHVGGGCCCVQGGGGRV